MMSGQDCLNLILNTKHHSSLCVQAFTHTHTSLPKYTMCFENTTKCTFDIAVCVCPSHPDMQEFEHELYIATQQPSSGPCSQTNNGQHDNSIMKWATWPPPSRGAVTLDICISKMLGLIVAPLTGADIKKWINYFSQATRSTSLCGRNSESDSVNEIKPLLNAKVTYLFTNWFEQLWFEKNECAHGWGNL